VLPNPTRKEGKCRGVDWVVEQMINLPTKDTSGGRGSNYTKKRVHEESPLIHIYSQCCENITRNFHLELFTSQQGAPDITKTLGKTSKYMQEHVPNERRTARTTAYIVPDIINQGQDKMFSGDAAEPEHSLGEEKEVGDMHIEPEDLLVE
ncbi:hypothetical protein B0H14DRAFT_2353277, partial [Mycena olivaceomarginata]